MSQPSPLTPARQRARALADSGDRRGAIALLEHAVGLGRVNLGEDDPDVLAAAHQLARVHLDVDDPASARRVLEETYAAGQWRLGDSDPLMLEISYDLGFVAEELGNRHEARKALTRVVEVGQPVLGDFHWAVVKAKAYLGGDTGALRPPQPMQQAAPVVNPPPRIPQATLPTPQTQPPGQRGGSPAHRIPSPRSEQPAPPVEQPRVLRTPGRPPLKQRVPQQSAVPPSAPAPVWAEPRDVPAWPAEAVPAPRTPDPPAVDPRVVDEPTVPQPVIQPRLPNHQPPLPVHHRPGPPAHPDHQPPWPEPGGPAYGGRSADGKRGPVLFAAIAAVLAAIIAVAALVFVLADRGGEEPARPDVPTLGGGPPPSDVRLDDFGSSVTVSWTDPGPGRTSFIVTGGHPGEVLRSMGTVGPGQTRFTLQGLNDRLDYCFAVLAVYSTTEFASSPQVCTSRPGPGRTG